MVLHRAALALRQRHPPARVGSAVSAACRRELECRRDDSPVNVDDRLRGVVLLGLAVGLSTHVVHPRLPHVDISALIDRYPAQRPDHQPSGHHHDRRLDMSTEVATVVLERQGLDINERREVLLHHLGQRGHPRCLHRLRKQQPAAPTASRITLGPPLPRQPHQRREVPRHPGLVTGLSVRLPGSRPALTPPDPPGHHTGLAHPTIDRRHHCSLSGRGLPSDPTVSQPPHQDLTHPVCPRCDHDLETQMAADPKVQVSGHMILWRWGESNPRPTVMMQGFSGRSPLVVFSAPALTRASCRRAQSLFGFPSFPATGSEG